jgi:hypothetical protein
MKMKKIFILVLSVSLLGSCTKKLDELLVNPNGPTPESANADLYLTQLQLNFAGFFNGASSYGMELTRQIVMYGPTYQQAYSPQSFDGLWSTAYTGVFKHANALIPVAEAEKKWIAAGMAKTIKAYTLITLVDMFGDIPFSTANLGSENTNPTIDKGSDVYAAAIGLLDAAIADFQKSTAYPGNQDMFYGAANATGAARWRTTAKLLKLRAINNTRLVDGGAIGKINTLLADADIISAMSGTANDFEFRYSTKQANPNSRHPRYNGNYSAAGSAGDYMGVYFMWSLAADKGTFNNQEVRNTSDPRTRYYFYRQTTNDNAVSSNTLSCSTFPVPSHYLPGMPFCQFGLGAQGFWGRNHGDNSGIPPDGPYRTTVGIYPFGGDFDANQNLNVGLNRGAQGAGIQPIWQAAFTNFLAAEAALSGANGNPRSLLEAGVRASISKVIGYPATVNVSAPASFVPDGSRVTAYVDKVLERYDAATTNDERMEVIQQEYYIALWGNGVDAFNNYRRTGKPGKMSYTVAQAGGDMIRSFFYPSVLVNLNKNITQKTLDKKVFWDTNPAILK